MALVPKSVQTVLDKLNELCGTDIREDDCYNVTTTDGPYGMSAAVVFCIADEPSDIQVFATVYEEDVTDLMWHSDGWQSINEFRLVPNGQLSV